MTVSEPERLILDALAISPDLPKIQHRAEVILKAANGLDDDQIGASLSMQPEEVLRWRKRFERRGVRGLWQEPGPVPEKHVTPEKERELLWDLLYNVSGYAGIFNFNNKLLAQLHHLSRHQVNRICAKHGIQRDKFSRVNIDRLKIFQDPLFGVTVSGIAGMVSGVFSALALRSSRRPFSEFIFWTKSPVEQTMDPFLTELRQLAQAHEFLSAAASQSREINEKALVDWLNLIEVKRTPDSEVHLLMNQPTLSPLNSAAFREWLAAHPEFRAYYAPKLVRMSWFQFIFRCFTIIAKLPVQSQLMIDMARLTPALTSYAKHYSRATFFVDLYKADQ